MGIDWSIQCTNALPHYLFVSWTSFYAQLASFKIESAPANNLSLAISTLEKRHTSPRRIYLSFKSRQFDFDRVSYSLGETNVILIDTNINQSFSFLDAFHI